MNRSYKDTALNEAHLDVGYDIEQFTTKLDETSHDIKELERWLTDCNICVSAEVRVSDHLVIAWDTHNGGRKFELIACDGGPIRRLIESSLLIRAQAKPFLPELVREIAKVVNSLT